jgi:hypothetical protein
MKDIILITAYCPSFKQENILRNLIQSIDKKLYDIAIVSHLPIPISIQNETKYYFYDSENILTDDLDFKPDVWAKTSLGTIYHTQINRKAHVLAIDKLFSTGLSCLKTLGYTKVHLLEYDTLVLDNELFKINSKDLNKYDCVFYINSKLHEKAILGNYIAINLNLINPEFLKFNLDSKINYYKNSLIKMPEINTYLTLTKQNNYLSKSFTEITPYLKTNISDISWEEQGYVKIIPYVENDEFKIFLHNSTLKNVIVTISINGKEFLYNLIPNYWVFNPYGNYNEVNEVKAYINENLYFDFNLNKLNRTQFKSRHYIKLTY